jgi:hypothetical protein
MFGHSTYAADTSYLYTALPLLSTPVGEAVRPAPPPTRLAFVAGSVLDTQPVASCAAIAAWIASPRVVSFQALASPLVCPWPPFSISSQL